MEPTHQIHHTKPKIAKNASSKLPEAFRMQSTIAKKAEKMLDEQKNLSEQKQEPNKQKKQEVKKDRQSKNPFLPIKQFIKKAAQFEKQFKGSDWNNKERFAKYSIQNNKTQIKYKYENCMTLAQVKKSTGGCLKKVLHVPTLSVHFLKQALISSHFDKPELDQWIQVVNKEASPSMKVLEVFWNMPQNYYSLLYEYSQGLLLDSVNQTVNALPSSLLREIAELHFGVNIGIFNSHIILHQDGAQPKIIRYLPIYQESQFSISQMPRLKQILESEIGPEDGARISRKFSWRLGILILNGYLGTCILAQEIPKIQLPLKKCCLLHEILSNPSSISAPYLQLGCIEDEIADFLCHCLSSHRNSDKKFQLSSLKKHRWFTKNYNKQPDQLSDILNVVNPTYTKHSKVELNKVSLNKLAPILESVRFILQNVTGADLNITVDNKGVIDLSKEIGMSNQVQKVVAELKKIYKNQKK